MTLDEIKACAGGSTMKHNVVIDLSFEQEQTLKALTKRHNKVSDANITEDDMLNRMLFIGNEKWFAERVSALNMALNGLELVHAKCHDA
jgi:hypothetical protein